MEPFSHDSVAYIVDGQRDDPGDGIGNIKRFGGVEGFEDGEYPQHSHSAHTENRHDHRHPRGSHSTKRSYKHVHNSAEEVGGADDGEADHACAYDLLWSNA